MSYNNDGGLTAHGAYAYTHTHTHSSVLLSPVANQALILSVSEQQKVPGAA